MSWLGRVAGALWELPQNALGVAVLAGAYATGRVSRVDVVEGRLVVEADPLGISLGSFVFHHRKGNRYFPPDPLMKKHELGHTHQSRRLGPLYLPIVGVSSSARALYAMAHREVTGRMWPRYFDGFPEKQADRYGGISAEERSAWVSASYRFS